MAAGVELALSDEDIAALAAISRSRTEPASRVERARMLLSYRKDSSFFCGGADYGCAPSDCLALR
jgi:hypothetical protein